MATFTFFIIAWTRFWQLNLKDNQLKFVICNSVVTCFCEWWHWKPAHLSRTEWSLSHPLLGICGSSSAPISAAPPWQTSPPDQQQYPRSATNRQQLIWAFKRNFGWFFLLIYMKIKMRTSKLSTVGHINDTRFNCSQPCTIWNTLKNDHVLRVSYVS